MEFAIVTSEFASEPRAVPITGLEYENARTAAHGLKKALDVEEKYNLVVENYAELERDLLSATLERVLFDLKDWSSLMDEIHVLGNRRLMNLLATCRMYLHQVCQDVNAVYGKSSEAAAAIKAQTNAEFDARLGYRVMEEIRNYIQHRSLPVQGVSHRGEWRGDDGSALCVNTIHLTLNVSALEASQFKRARLEELRALGAKPDLKPLIRDYMAGLGGVHATARAQLAADILVWERTIVDMRGRVRAATRDDHALGIAVARRANGSDYVDHVYVTEAHSDRRRALETRNRSASHFPRHVVASE